MLLEVPRLDESKMQLPLEWVVEAETPDSQTPQRRWNKQDIISAVLLREEDQLTLSKRNVAEQDPRLYWAGIRHFRTWRKAVEAAGLDYNAIQRKEHPTRWSPENVITAIHCRQQQKRFLSNQYVAAEDPALHSAGRRYFGTWRKAVEAAGLDYKNIARNEPSFNAQSYCKWSKNEIIAAILKREKGKLQLSGINVGEQDSRLLNAGKRYFGTWRKAVEAAGLDYNAIQRKEHPNQTGIPGVRPTFVRLDSPAFSGPTRHTKHDRIGVNDPGFARVERRLQLEAVLSQVSNSLPCEIQNLVQLVISGGDLSDAEYDIISNIFRTDSHLRELMVAG